MTDYEPIIVTGTDAPYDAITPLEMKKALGGNTPARPKGPRVQNHRDGRLNPAQYDWSSSPRYDRVAAQNKGQNYVSERITFNQEFDIEGNLQGHTPEGLAKIASNEGFPVKPTDHNNIMALFGIPESDYKAAFRANI